VGNAVKSFFNHSAIMHLTVIAFSVKNFVIWNFIEIKNIVFILWTLQCDSLNMRQKFLLLKCQWMHNFCKKYD
jgi:hypothetical protein